MRTKPLQLYQLTDTTTKKPVPALFFNDKKQAKNKRQELNAEYGETLRFVVSPGPDHKKYHV